MCITWDMTNKISLNLFSSILWEKKTWLGIIFIHAPQSIDCKSLMKSKEKCSVLGRNNLIHQCRLGAAATGKQLCRKRSGALVDTTLIQIKDCEPAIHHWSKEGWQQPGLYEGDCSLQVRGGDAFPPHSTGVTWEYWSKCRKLHKETKTTGTVQPSEDKTLGTSAQCI